MPTEREASPVETQRDSPRGLDRERAVPHSDAAATATRAGRDDHGTERHMYIFITLLLALLISGFGAGFAFACRMQPDENRDESAR